MKIQESDTVNITGHSRIDDQKATVIETYDESHVKLNLEHAQEMVIVPIKYVKIDGGVSDPFVKHKEQLKQALADFDDPHDPAGVSKITKSVTKLINYIKDVNHKQI